MLKNKLIRIHYHIVFFSFSFTQLQRSGHAPAIGARGRPASVDIDGILLDGGGGSDESQSPESGSPAYGEHVVQSQHHSHQQQHNLQQQQQQLYHHQQQQQQLLLEQQHGNLKVANTSNVSSMNSGNTIVKINCDFVKLPKHGFTQVAPLTGYDL